MLLLCYRFVSSGSECLWLPMNESSGTIARGYSSSNLGGNLVGTPQWTLSPNIYPYALLVPIGQPSYLNLAWPSQSCFNSSSNISVMLWMKPTIMSTASQWANYATAGPFSMTLCPPGGNGLCVGGTQFVIAITPSGTGTCQKYVSIVGGVWQHITIVVGGNDFLIYLNGALAPVGGWGGLNGDGSCSSFTWDGGINVGSSFSVGNIVGYNAGAGGYPGANAPLSDFRIYPWSLRPSEIAVAMTGAGVTKCLKGQYFNQSCKQCLPSYYCPNGFDSIFCPAGSYCPLGSLNATLCIIGSFSLAAASNCTLCPAGTYTSATGSSSCQQCPGGHYCPAGTSSWARLNCGRGNYCPDGSGTPSPCPYQVPPTGGWGALQVQGPAFLVETARCLNHCFWNFTSGDGMLSKC